MIKGVFIAIFFGTFLFLNPLLSQEVEGQSNFIASHLENERDSITYLYYHSNHSFDSRVSYVRVKHYGLATNHLGLGTGADLSIKYIYKTVALGLGAGIFTNRNIQDFPNYTVQNDVHFQNSLGVVVGGIYPYFRWSISFDYLFLEFRNNTLDRDPIGPTTAFGKSTGLQIELPFSIKGTNFKQVEPSIKKNNFALGVSPWVGIKIFNYEIQEASGWTLIFGIAIRNTSNIVKQKNLLLE